MYGSTPPPRAIMKAFYYFITETTTCQRLVGNLKLNPLSAQIIIYCLMTNRMLALLEGRASWNASCSEDMTVWHMTDKRDSFIFKIFSRKIEGDSARRVTSLPLPPMNPDARLHQGKALNLDGVMGKYGSVNSLTSARPRGRFSRHQILKNNLGGTSCLV